MASDDGSENINGKSDKSEHLDDNKDNSNENHSGVSENEEESDSEVSSDDEYSDSESSGSNIDTDRDESQIIEKPRRIKKKKNREPRILVGPPSIRPNQQCQKHEGQVIHSYLKQKIKKSQLKEYEHTLMCTQCIYEQDLNQSQIQIIPQVMYEIKQKIQSTRNLIQYRKNQLQQAQGYFHRIQQGNR